MRGLGAPLFYFLCSVGKRYRIFYSFFTIIKIIYFLSQLTSPYVPCCSSLNCILGIKMLDVLCFDFTPNFDECRKTLQWFKAWWEGLDLPTVAGCQMPPKLLSHSPPQLDGERKYSERLVGQDKDRERPLTRYSHEQNRLESGKLVSFITNQTRRG